MVGVNKHRLDNEPPLDVLKVDNADVRRSQIAKLERLRFERDQERVDRTLAALTDCAQNSDGNFLALAVEAARAQATVGEMSAALERCGAVIRRWFGCFGRL